MASTESNLHLSKAVSTAIERVRTGEYSTPLVVLDTSQLAYNLASFRKHLPKVRLYFAVKSNSTAQVLQYFVNEGLSFDVASTHEIRLLRHLKAPSSHLIVSHPIKDDATIREMVAAEIRTCAVDSVDEIDKLCELRLPYSLHILVRIMVESSSVAVNLNDKFGCNPASAASILHYAGEKGLVPAGLAFHVGSQSFGADNYRIGIDKCLEIAEAYKNGSSKSLSTINIGGGFCDRETALANATTLDDLLQKIAIHVQKAERCGYAIIAEPGRALVADAATLICKVIGINVRGGIPLVHVDDGIYGALSPQTYEARTYKIEAVFRPQGGEALGAEKMQVQICGRTCDSLDMLKGSHFLPTNIRRGDLIIVPNVGAYGTVNASAFNGFEPPQTVF